MKTIYAKIFRTIATTIDRIVFAAQMYPTKNPNTNNWIYKHRIASSAYPDGSRFEYLNGVDIRELNRKKV